MLTAPFTDTAEGDVRSVTIVGGGTAACMAAASLRKFLPENVKINMIEPKANMIIGVGEATVPSIRFFMRSLGLKESEWLPLVGGTLKAGIKFSDWTSKRDHYYHPFYKESDLKAGVGTSFDYNFSMLDVMNRGLANSTHFDFLNNVSIATTICDNNLSPVTREKKSLMSYAYHIDSSRFGRFLKSKAVEWGVKDYYGSVEHVETDDDGSIRSLKLDTGEIVESDFYIDATGFNSILIQKKLGAEFVSYSDKLFTDSALALSFEHSPDRQLPPYTEAKATDTGWIWKIPLRNRIGAGIVFNSKYDDFDSVEKKLRAEFSTKALEGERANKIKMRIGRLKESWIKNCVALGLASSFIEPLESTSIGITEYQIFLLRKLFPSKKKFGPLPGIFNRYFADCYDHVVRFISLHYLMGDRTDSDFWKMIDVRRKTAESLELMRNVEESIIVGDGSHAYKMYNRFSYACMATGLGHKIPINLVVEPSVIRAADELHRKLEKLREETLSARYTHADFIFGEAQS